MGKMRFCKEDYRDSNINFKDNGDEKINLYTLCCLGEELDISLTKLVIDITNVLNVDGQILNLCGVGHKVVIDQIKNTILSNCNDTNLQLDNENTVYSTFLMQINDISDFKPLLQVAWSLSGNEMLCWFWSDRKFNIKDIMNKHNMDLTIDINKYGFVLVRGSDGDECLIYGSSDYDNTNRVKDLIEFLSKNDVEIC
jgi:hypothetical protein